MKRIKFTFKLLAVAGIPILLLGALFIYTGLAIDESDFEHGHNVSRTTGYDLSAGLPQVASYSDTVVIAWSEGLKNSKTSTEGSGHIYIESARESEGFWRPLVKVQTATVETGDIPLQNLGREPQLIFDKTVPPHQAQIVHLVWSNGQFDQSAGENFYYPEIRYARCDVSTLLNACQPAVAVAAAGQTSLYRNPDIAQDDNGHLHVVWTDLTDESNPVLRYSRSADGVTWSSAQEISAASGTKASNPQLLFANQRLHLVWDNEASDNIQYIYDDNYSDNNFLAVGAKTWSTNDGAYGSFQGGDPGFPTIAALEGGLAGAPDVKLLFVAFDVQHPDQGKEDTFALAYGRSDTNGTSWKALRGITSQSTNLGQTASIYQSEGQTPPFVGLKPRLIITSTGVLAWGNIRLNAVWHNNVSEGESGAFQVVHSSGVVTDTTVGGGLAGGWDEKINVSNPPSLNPRAVQGPYDRDTVGPAMVVTDPQTGGLGKAHAVFLEREGDLPNDDPWDVYYRGVIKGTIDPDYMKDPLVFALKNVVTPTLVVTSAATVAPITLNYSIEIANKGELDVIGVSITNTLANEIDSITTFTPPSIGTIQGDFDNGRFMWTGNIPAGATVRIDFTAVTTSPIELNTYVVNSVDLWNTYLGGEPILNAKASTEVRQWRIYLPIMFK